MFFVFDLTNSHALNLSDQIIFLSLNTIFLAAALFFLKFIKLGTGRFFVLKNWELGFFGSPLLGPCMLVKNRLKLHCKAKTSVRTKHKVHSAEAPVTDWALKRKFPTSLGVLEYSISEKNS